MTARAKEGIMMAMPVMPHDVRDWTVDDLDLLPDDGLQYELRQPRSRSLSPSQLSRRR